MKTNPELGIKRPEDDHVGSILNKTQYELFLSIIYRDKAIVNTNVAWQQLKKLDLTQHLDSAITTKDIMNYESIFLIAQERIKYIKDTKITDSLRKSVAAKKPLVLLKLDAYNDKINDSQFGEAIKNRKELNLSDIQIDSLIAKVKVLESLKREFKTHNIEGNYNDRAFVYKSLTNILTLNQYDNYLQIKNKPKAILYAGRDWEKLRRANMTLNIDSTKTFAENYNYEILLLVANERLTNEKNQNNVYAKKEIEENKPSLLKQLDQSAKALDDQHKLGSVLKW